MSSFTTKAKISLHNQTQTEQKLCGSVEKVWGKKKGQQTVFLYMKLKFHSNNYLCPVYTR